MTSVDARGASDKVTRMPDTTGSMTQGTYEAAALLDAGFGDLQAEARRRRADTHGTRITFSPKVFIPLTMLCRDRCGYCTFAKAPARLESPYLSLDDVLAIARAGRQAGCHEALFTLGEGPEDRYPAARAWLSEHGFTSTVDYLAQACRLVVEETGLLPHANAGALDRTELTALREVSASQGMMIESVNPDLAAHRSAPDKTPARRLATLEAAGRCRHPVHHRPPGRYRREPGRPAGHVGCHRREPRPSRTRPGGDRPELPAQSGYVDAQRPSVPDRRVPLDHRRRPPRAPRRHPSPGSPQPVGRPRSPARFGDRRLGRGIPGDGRPRQPRARLARPRDPPRRHRGGWLHAGSPPHPLSRIRHRSRAVAVRVDAVPRPRRLRRRGPGP